MANVFVDDSSLTAVADAIREKTGSTAKMLPSEMAGLIESIEAGGTATLVTGTITPAEDTYTITINQDLSDCEYFALGIWTAWGGDDDDVLITWYIYAAGEIASYTSTATANDWGHLELTNASTGTFADEYGFRFVEGYEYEWYLMRC